MQDAAYSRDARDLRSSSVNGLYDPIAESACGDLGGVRVAGKDVCREFGNVVVVGDEGGLHCEVALRNVGGW